MRKTATQRSGGEQSAALAALAASLLDETEKYAKDGVKPDSLQDALDKLIEGNLWSKGQVDLEIQVLGHKKVVIGRPFAGSQPAAQEPVQMRFEALLGALRRLSL